MWYSWVSTNYWTKLISKDTDLKRCLKFSFGYVLVVCLELFAIWVRKHDNFWGSWCWGRRWRRLLLSSSTRRSRLPLITPNCSPTMAVARSMRFACRACRSATAATVSIERRNYALAMIRWSRLLGAGVRRWTCMRVTATDRRTAVCWAFADQLWLGRRHRTCGLIEFAEASRQLIVRFLGRLQTGDEDCVRRSDCND